MNFYKAIPKDIRYRIRNLRHLVFEVTDRCNLNCKYCTYSELYRGNDARVGSDMSYKRAKMIIDYLYDLWKEDKTDGNNYEFAVSFYGGEPLMNVPFIKQVIEYLDSLELEKIGKIITFSMTTNAMLLDQYMDYLVEKGFSLLISLDGDEFAQSYRIDHDGKDSFDRVFRNINLLKEKYPEYFKNKVSFNSVLHNRNNVEGTVQFIRTQFDKIPRISPINEVGICEEKKEEFVKMYRNFVESFFQSRNCEAIESELFLQSPRVALLSDYIMYQSGNNYQDFNELCFNKDDTPIMTTGTCVPFATKMFVTVSGKILPCERIMQQFSLGQVHADRVELNEEYIAERHNYYVSKYEKQCANCADNRSCMQCVYQIDDICKENTLCPNSLTKKELEKRNEDIFKFLKEYPHYYRKILEEVKNER